VTDRISADEAPAPVEVGAATVEEPASPDSTGVEDAAVVTDRERNEDVAPLTGSAADLSASDDGSDAGNAQGDVQAEAAPVDQPASKSVS
jgi:hypothetical protein